MRPITDPKSAMKTRVALAPSDLKRVAGVIDMLRLGQMVEGDEWAKGTADGLASWANKHVAPPKQRRNAPEPNQTSLLADDDVEELSETEERQ